MAIAAPLGIVLAVSASIAAPPRIAAPAGAGSRVVSASVVATLITQVSPSGKTALDLLVLWRGAPGWFLGGARSGSATWGGGATGGPDNAAADPSASVVAHRLSYGDRSMAIRFNRTTRSLQIDGMAELQLQEANVVLIDGVDDPGGPTMAGIARVDDPAAELPARIDSLIRASPELLAFLRCDASLDQPAMQSLVQMVACNPPAR